MDRDRDTGIFYIFYDSGPHWFNFVANLSVWILIAIFITVLIWIGYLIVKGKTTTDDEVKRLLQGLTSATASPSTTGTHKAEKVRPFGRRPASKTPGKHAGPADSTTDLTTKS